MQIGPRRSSFTGEPLRDNVFEFEGRAPAIDPSAWLAPTATVIGDVTIGPGASVWYGAVIRGDVSPITIGARTNIQDGSIVHAGYDAPLAVGEDVTVGHACVVHCSEVEDGALIGNGAVLLDAARVGARSVVAANSVVVAGTVVPAGMIAAGQPAKVRGSTEGSSAEMWLDHNAAFYADLARRHQHTTRLVRSPTPT